MGEEKAIIFQRNRCFEKSFSEQKEGKIRFMPDFTVPKSQISSSEGQLLLAYNIDEDNIDGWIISEQGDIIRGHSDADSDALDDYLERIGFDVRKMVWRD